MLNKELKVKEIFNAFKNSTDILIKSYDQYDDTTKQDIIFDLTYEFMQELQYYVAEDDFCDLLEDYRIYEED